MGKLTARRAREETDQPTSACPRRQTERSLTPEQLRHCGGNFKGEDIVYYYDPVMNVLKSLLPLRITV